MTSERDVVELLTLAEECGIDVRIDGGWGVDALLGHQTRAHNDLDLFIEKHNGGPFVAMLKHAGFRQQQTDYTTSDHTVWQDTRNRIVDLHLFEFTADGRYRFEGADYPAETFGATGQIGGRKVQCIPAHEQVLFHLGYEHDQNDVRDVLLLCEHFDIPIPKEYK